MSSNVNHKRSISTARLSLAACAALACVLLAACGSSKGSSTTTSTSTATTSTSASASTSAAGASDRGGRFSALRECLAKNGVALPRPPGVKGGPGAFFLGGGPRAGRVAATPAKRAQLQAAMKKCGAPAGFGVRLHRFGSNSLRDNHAFKQALTRFAACLRANGVNVPTPNLSGKGPVFDTMHVDTASAQFRSAQVKCRGALRAGGL